MSEHPIDQPIISVVINEREAFSVGHGGVDRIEATTKSGLHADMPYIRVWRDGQAVAEFCQHNIVGVYFGAKP